ncbi:MAG: hypothetical protein JWM93_547 [Frankiales bacterium]|nr:hypothetical protein [Frankiales bacterium]
MSITHTPDVQRTSPAIPLEPTDAQTSAGGRSVHDEASYELLVRSASFAFIR